MRSLNLICALIFSMAITGCQADTNEQSQNDLLAQHGSANGLGASLRVESSMPIDYAKQFRVEYLNDGFKLFTIKDRGQFLLVPENQSIPSDLDENISILQAPIDNMFIASTTSGSSVNSLKEIDRFKYTSNEAEDWYIEDIKKTMVEERLTYVGHHKEPDFEILAREQPDVSIFTAMIDSTPEVMAKLKELDIPVIVERSHAEEHPLGRSEWIKFYGAMFNVEDKAEEIFNKEVEYVNNLPEIKETKESVAIFHITSSGNLYVRNGSDYLVKMAELAGAEYILKDINPEETSIAKIDFETFYSKASEADNIIYIWSSGGKPADIEELVKKNELLENFKAIKTGSVYCTTADFFQLGDSLGKVMKDMSTAFYGNSDDMQYLFKLD
ncbi:MAG: hypothetical protein ATN31_03905 [Candidatus Epulonipiscioides saccharophilum]|nr:MAG: hypothetical protein ATN31_03905 [Epulopiscium sp. AS2M-Bin001]